LTSRVAKKDPNALLSSSLSPSHRLCRRRPKEALPFYSQEASSWLNVCVVLFLPFFFFENLSMWMFSREEKIENFFLQKKNKKLKK
jgi:hypothetical protein